MRPKDEDEHEASAKAHLAQRCQQDWAKPRSQDIEWTPRVAIKGLFGCERSEAGGWRLEVRLKATPVIHAKPATLVRIHEPFYTLFRTQLLDL
jgi:hypothetical protein